MDNLWIIYGDIRRDYREEVPIITTTANYSTHSHINVQRLGKGAFLCDIC